MGIQKDLYEAARVDGATPLQQFTKITLPVLKPITYLVVTLGIIWSFQVFDLAYLMTGGGPGHSSVTLVMGIYNAAFKQYKMGYACAMAMFLLLMIIIINVVKICSLKRKGGEIDMKKKQKWTVFSILGLLILLVFAAICIAPLSTW